MSKLKVRIVPESGMNTLSYSGNYRIFSSEEPVTDALSILGISEGIDIGSGDVSKLNRFFRYSSDRLNWSMWYGFVPDGSPSQGMDVISAIRFNPDADIYVQYKYEYDDGTYDPLASPLIVDYVSTQYDMRNVSAPLDADSVAATSCTSEFCPALVFDRGATFNPYDAGNFANLYSETSYYVNRTFGLPVLYFRTEPNVGGGDYIFKEWNLVDVVERKCIKVCVPNNDFPDSKLHYNEFGIDYDVPFEIHIDKMYFETMFNPQASVRKKDFLYFPILNRMYEIQGSYMFRGFMMKPLYWKAQLVKFKPNINYIMRAEDTQFLDNLLVDSEEMLSAVANGDIRDAVMPDQYKTISTRHDETRRSLNALLSVRQVTYYFNYAPLIDYYYDLSRGMSANDVAVEYVKTGLLDDGFANMTFTCMFNARQSGVAFKIIESKKPGSPDPNIGIVIGGTVTGTNLKLDLTINGVLRQYSFAGVAVGAWYGLIITLSKEFGQIGVFLYEPIEDVADSINHNEFRLNWQYVEQASDISFETGAGYVLRQSPLYLANVRIFNVGLKYEDHSYVLSQLFVRDESLLYVIDNCRPRLNMPVVSKVR